MSKQNTSGPKQRLSRLELSAKPTLIITEKLKRQIDFLHNKVGKDEWSGELITREEGSITDPENWRVIAEDIFLADVGTGTYTGYTVDRGAFKNVDIIQMYDAFPGLMDGTHKNHHIHTHHNMGAFFSGTDWEQLEDRGVTCNYFIMLVVDFKGTYEAKVAFKAKKKVDATPMLEFANNTDGLKPFQLKKGEEHDVLAVMNMNVHIPTISHMVPLDEELRGVMGEMSKQEQVQEDYLAILLEYLNDSVKNKSYLVDEPFKQRYERVITAHKEDKNTAGYTGGSQVSMFHQHDDDDWDTGWNNDDSRYDKYRWDPMSRTWVDKTKEEKHVKGSKRISEMTDEEFKKEDQENWGESKVEFDMNNAKQLLNACIAGNYFNDKITNPVGELKKKDKKLNSKQRRDEWVQDFQAEISSKMYDFWQDQPTAADCLVLLDLCLKVLEDSRTTPLINDVYEAIETEMSYLQDEIQYYSTYNKSLI